jgi:hypothetical protein
MFSTSRFSRRLVPLAAGTFCATEINGVTIVREPFPVIDMTAIPEIPLARTVTQLSDARADLAWLWLVGGQ